MQPKTLSWSEIRDAIATDIETGRLLPGSRLASEPELCARFGSGRHSVRKALRMLSSEGRVKIEHGRGVFVPAEEPVRYVIDRRVRIFEQLEAQGHQTRIETLLSDQGPADRKVADALGLIPGDAVHINDIILICNNLPIGLGRSYHPLERFPDYREHRRFAPTQLVFYRSYGIASYFRSDTLISARRAMPEESERLRLGYEATVLETRTVDMDPHQCRIGLSMTVWASSRVEFVVPSLPH